MSIEQMRREYVRGGLDENEVDPDPVAQFQRWFSEAQQPDLPEWMEVNAVTLSTADRHGCVSSRIVLLKGIDQGRFRFYTNYDSAKGQQLAENPRLSVCVFWPHLERQVRIDGEVDKVDRQRSIDYFHSRPRDSQIGAHVSEQSTEVAGRQDLERRMEELRAEYEGQEIPCPENWGGYAIVPGRVEFWQGRASRLHDRICYLRDPAGGWKRVRLSP